MSRRDGIYEFVHVAEAQGFSAAARQLNVSTSQISKSIAKLEDRLGVRLINRTTRRFTLTAEGEHFYLRCKKILEDFDQAELDVSSHRSDPHGIIRINIAGNIPDYFLIPLLGNLTRDYSRLKLDLRFTEQRQDLVGGGFDLAIWEGELETSTLVARKLLENRYLLVAHPDYIASHALPNSIHDLQQHSCIAAANSHWPLIENDKVIDWTVEGNWFSNQVTSQRQAALAGMGIARLPLLSIWEDLQTQRLVQVLPTSCRYSQPVWVLYPHHRQLSAKTRLLVDFFSEQFNRFQLSV
jgi:DNA-binding transcriptional LysR family regulator